MSSVAETWATAIGYVADANGMPSIDTVVRHIRAAIVESGYVTRSRLTSGLKEAYRPFAIDGKTLSILIEDALRLLLLTGDIDQFSTAAGRGYTTTPPRRVGWSGAQVAILGGVALETKIGSVRRLTPAEAAALPAAEVSLADELRRPDWRTALVSLGGADAVDGDPSALFAYVSALAASGERYALETIEAIAVLAGRGDFFGKDEPILSGRWSRVAGDGVFPAIIRSGYQARNVVVHVASGEATLWQPPDRDIWHWIVIGSTLAQGDPVLRYNPATEQLTFLTPLPRQLERAVRLTGVQQAPWSWQVGAAAFSVIDGFTRPRSGAGAAIPKAVSRA